MTQHIEVATVAELPAGTHKVVQVGPREIGIFNVRGEFYAIPNVCFHQNGPLCRGSISGTVRADENSGWKLEWTHEGEIVICPWHSLEFNVTTGECVAYPARRLPTYPLRVENGRIFFVADK
jgi:nitrite reductase (NADH) small subunit